MTTRIAINGLGRIGRCVLRALFDNKESFGNIELVAVNATTPIETLRHIIKYDSVHGKFAKSVEISENKDALIVDGKSIKLLAQRDPKTLPWADLKIDVVLECTGAFTDKKDAAQHITAGAKKVIISAPAKGEDVKTIVYGVNDDKLAADDQVISIGSCTTNCIAPIAKILDATVGIEKGFMTTIHAYTNDQNIVDNAHKDLRRARACALSMIPTSTGAAKAIGLVLPQLAGKLDGGAIRVPTPNVSMIDLNFIAKKDTSIAEINETIKSAIKSDKKLATVLEYVTEPLVSIDFNHSTFSSCFDSTQTKVLAKNMVKVCAWYDNEWGFSVRMLDIAKLMKN